MQQININDRETLARSISQFRRTIVREFVFSILRTFGDFDFSLPQLATLLLLDEEGELTIKQVTEILVHPHLSCNGSATLLRKYEREEELIEGGGFPCFLPFSAPWFCRHAGDGW